MGSILSCRLEGVPIISGKANISYHAHFGPVRMFLPLQQKVRDQFVHLYCTV